MKISQKKHQKVAKNLDTHRIAEHHDTTHRTFFLSQPINGQRFVPILVANGRSVIDTPIPGLGLFLQGGPPRIVINGVMGPL